MPTEQPLVVVARYLLPAGTEPLEKRFIVTSGGLDADRESMLDAVHGADAIVGDASVPVDAPLLDAAGPNLRVVANFAVGYDNVDLQACRNAGVVVTNTPDVLTNATAELALALTLTAARRLSEAERSLRAGEWKGWDPGQHLGLELSGSTVGIIGLGRIGRRYAELMSGLGVELLHSSRSAKPEAERALPARGVGLDELLADSDVVSVHAPATPETHHLIDARALALMRPTAVLVNTSRGGLADLDAVAAALEDDALGAAGMDVYEGEPAVPERLLAAPRTTLTPHIGSATRTAREAMARTVAANVIAVLDGREPPNPVPLPE